MSRIVEILALVAIAAVIAAGGGPFLQNIAHWRGIGLVVLVALTIAQLGTLRRPGSSGDGVVGLRRTARVIFIASTLLAIAYVCVPARWSSGAAIVAVEFGLTLELLRRLAPESIAPS